MSDMMFDEIGIAGGVYVYGDWKKIATHNETCIKGFFGPYRFLSNMWPSPVWFDGVLYLSVENAYQAAKFLPSEREYFLTCSPYESKKASVGKLMRYSTREWNEIKVPIMYFLLLQKFDAVKQEELFRKLQETSGMYLDETNWWNDTFWGSTLEGVGSNTLGMLLMRVRDGVRKKTR